jgi:Cu/Ag efflux protein CusF
LWIDLEKDPKKEKSIMKKLFVRLLAVAMIFAVPTLTVAKEAMTSEKKPATETTETGKKPKIEKGEMLKLHATIEAIDKENKTVTLKGPRGRLVILPVENPKNLEAVTVGDPVLVKYYEAVAIEVKKHDDAVPGTKVEQSRTTSKPGEQPGGEIRSEVTVVATIQSIDRKQKTVTLLGPEGKTQTVKVKDSAKLKEVKVGDRVAIKYIEALTVSLAKENK